MFYTCRAVEPARPIGMRYWWVNQNQTFQQEFDGGYERSPTASLKSRRTRDSMSADIKVPSKSNSSARKSWDFFDVHKGEASLRSN